VCDDVLMDFDALREHKTGLGTAGVIVMDPHFIGMVSRDKLREHLALPFGQVLDEVGDLLVRVVGPVDNGERVDRREYRGSVAGVAAVLVLYYFWRVPSTHDRLLGALGLLLAGILGNVVDRVRLGFVIDFIDVQFGNWHYPTFNVADAAICAGAGLLILDMFFSKKDEKKTAAKANV